MNAMFNSTLLDHVNLFSVTLRLLLAMACGGVLGLEREQKRRPAGLRTYMLVCVGSALVMLTSQYVVEKMGTGDILRMGAQVVSGIGFLGAGTIMVTGHRQVKGLTTAAGLWVSACLGLAAGIGFYAGTLIGCVLIFMVLSWFYWLEEKLSKNLRIINVLAEMDTTKDLAGLLRLAKENELKISDMEISKAKKGETGLVVLFSVSWQGDKTHESVVRTLAAAAGVSQIEEF